MEATGPVGVVALKDNASGGGPAQNHFGSVAQFDSPERGACNFARLRLEAESQRREQHYR